MKIAVAGTGYVGLSNAVLLAQHNEVVALDINDEKVASINAKCTPIDDPEIKEFLENKALNLRATTDRYDAYLNADFIIVATPTDYDASTNYFDTSTVESVIRDVSCINPEASVIIKSTIPVGFTGEIKSKFPNMDIIFSPEFLREGRALYDNLYPSRIIIGASHKRAKVFASLLQQSALKRCSCTLYGRK